MSTSRTLYSPADLFALANGDRNTSKDGEHCHWCGSLCEKIRAHDDPPRMPFSTAPKSNAKYFGSTYICVGCWLWRRQRITVRYLQDSLKDCKTPCDFSWWITPGDARVLDDESSERLYALLLKPPRIFCLALLDGKGAKNWPQQMVANNFEFGISASDPIQYTINGIVFEYTIYELEELIKGSQGSKQSPGARELVRLLGPKKTPIQLGEEEVLEVKRGRGRPPGKITKDTENPSMRTIVSSGQFCATV